MTDREVFLAICDERGSLTWRIVAYPHKFSEWKYDPIRHGVINALKARGWSTQRIADVMPQRERAVRNAVALKRKAAA